MEQELLEKRETELLEKENSGCRFLLANDKADDLSRMYRLFARLPDQIGLHPIAEIVKQHILMIGNEKLERRVARIESEKETNQDPTFIRDLLSVHDKYMDVVSTQFEGNNLFQRALKHAFVEIVNKEVGKVKTAGKSTYVMLYKSLSPHRDFLDRQTSFCWGRIDEFVL